MGSALFLVRPAWAQSNRCKFVKCPNSGKLIPDGKGIYRYRIWLIRIFGLFDITGYDNM